MRMRREATTRSPASSSILVTAPVRLRRVASGLMIENVRETAMESSIGLTKSGLRAPLGWPSERCKRGIMVDRTVADQGRWKNRLREIGNIVLGVLIALGLGAIANEIGWKIEAASARSALAD